MPTGQIIQAQLYQICIRQEEGSCSIAYTTRQVDSSVDAFDMHGSAAKVIFDYLITQYLSHRPFLHIFCSELGLAVQLIFK